MSVVVAVIPSPDILSGSAAKITPPESWREPPLETVVPEVIAPKELILLITNDPPVTLVAPP